MRYLGIDYGTKRLGIAISDETGSFAFPRDVILFDTKVYEELLKIVSAEKIGAVVMGDTLTLNGGANDITKTAEVFATKAGEYLKIPIYRIREAWSSQEAARFAPQGKKHDDSSAAAIILQRYLDAQPRSEI